MKPSFLESRAITAEARVAELERMLQETQRARQFEAERADRADRRCRELSRLLDKLVGAAWRRAS